MFINIIILIIIIILVILAFPIVSRLVNSKEDTSFAKLIFVFSSLLTVLGILISYYTIDRNTTKLKDNTVSTLHSIANQIEEENYVNSSITQAENAFTDTDYLAAIEVIKDALDKYPDNKKLKEEFKKYKEYKPVLLSDYEWLKNTAKDDVKGVTYINEHNSDKYGNTYNTSFALSSGSVSFVTNKKYSKFKGIIACPKEFEYDSYRDSAKVSVYADDNIYLWSSSEIFIDSEPQPFDIDITDAKKITLVWECKGPNVWNNWGDYATIFDGAFYK